MRRSPAEVSQPQLTSAAAVHPHEIFFQAAVAKPPQPQPFHRALLSPDNLSSRTRAEPPTPQHTMCECRSPLVKELVKRGFGSTVLTYLWVAAEVERCELTAIPIDRPQIVSSICIGARHESNTRWL